MEGADVSAIIRVEIPGKPVPKARPRRNHSGHWWTPSSDHEKAVAMYFVRHRGAFPDGPVKVRYEFYCNPRQRSDSENLSKLISDAMTKAGVWGDDHQCTDLIVSRRTVPVGEERTVVFLSRPADWAALRRS